MIETKRWWLNLKSVRRRPLSFHLSNDRVVRSGFIQYIVEPSFVVMGDMLEKILRSLNVPDSELPSPSVQHRSVASSPSPAPSRASSNDSNVVNDEHGENTYESPGDEPKEK